MFPCCSALKSLSELLQPQHPTPPTVVSQQPSGATNCTRLRAAGAPPGKGRHRHSTSISGSQHGFRAGQPCWAIGGRWFGGLLNAFSKSDTNGGSMSRTCHANTSRGQLLAGGPPRDQDINTLSRNATGHLSTAATRGRHLARFNLDQQPATAHALAAAKRCATSFQLITFQISFR